MACSSRGLAQSASRISHTASRSSFQLTTTTIASPSSVCARRHISQSHPRRSTLDSQPPPNSSSTITTPDPLRQVFAHPTWSVRSLLLPPTTSPEAEQEAESEITSQTLFHHLRLSALPPPSSPDEEARLLATLRTQLRFVRAVQAVAEATATSVQPLRAIRDETSAGAAEATIGLDALRDALGRETRFGFRGRPRRRSSSSKAVSGGEAQDGTEGRERNIEERLVESATAGRRERGYYIVESGKAKGGE